MRGNAKRTTVILLSPDHVSPLTVKGKKSHEHDQKARGHGVDPEDLSLMNPHSKIMILVTGHELALLYLQSHLTLTKLHSSFVDHGKWVILLKILIKSASIIFRKFPLRKCANLVLTFPIGTAIFPKEDRRTFT